MFKLFLEKLIAFNNIYNSDWNEVKEEEFKILDNINILWYSSCGLDYKIFQEYSEENTNKRNLPTFDIFICSDYDRKVLKLEDWYNNFDNKEIYYGNEK
jgi:hypothetical protein